MSLTDDDRRAVDAYLAAWWAAIRAMGSRGRLKGTDWRDGLPEPPIALLQRAAVEYPDGKVKRFALSVLDHEANDASADTFRLALRDPSPKTRMAALHGLSCERCRVGELCVDDVVPALIAVLEGDDSPKVRQAAVGTLLLLAGRDDRVPAAFSRVAAADPDPYVREAAVAAREGNYKGVGSRKAMRRRERRQGATA